MIPRLAVARQDIGPVIRVAEICRQGLAFPDVAVSADTMRRPLPVVHDLGHRGCRAANPALQLIDLGAIVVVWRTLMPARLDHVCAGRVLVQLTIGQRLEECVSGIQREDVPQLAVTVDG